MTKYSNIQTDIEDVFASTDWTAHSIKAIPSNYSGNVDATEFVRLNIIHGGTANNSYGGSSIRGMIRIDIYVQSGKGEGRANAIADILDDLFQAHQFANGTQSGYSTLNAVGNDTDNPSLYRVNYSIPFTYYQ